MEKKVEVFHFNCEVCKNHCSLTVEAEGGQVFNVTGNGCLRGLAYAQAHLPEGKER